MLIKKCNQVVIMFHSKANLSLQFTCIEMKFLGDKVAKTSTKLWIFATWTDQNREELMQYGSWTDVSHKPRCDIYIYICGLAKFASRG